MAYTFEFNAYRISVYEIERHLLMGLSALRGDAEAYCYRHGLLISAGLTM